LFSYFKRQELNSSRSDCQITIYWNLFRDTAEPGRFVETFIVDSWAEHERQHGRLTKADREAEERVQRFHLGKLPLKISHFIAAV